MNLYIETDGNGNALNHPAFEDNLLEAFGSIPENWEAFVRVGQPTLSVYQITEPSYQKINNVWTDVWIVQDMTDAEKLAKQQSVQSAWLARPNASNFTAWTFDEATCQYLPPTPKPTDGQNYFWQGTTNTWVVIPVKPDDGQNYFWQGTTNTWVVIPVKPDDGQSYRFDIPTASWILVTQ